MTRLLIWLLVTCGLPIPVLAEGDISQSFEQAGGAEAGRQPPGYLARIELDNPEQLKATLQRTEEIYLSGELDGQFPPVTFILHGPEVTIFLQENYREYMDIVDLASRLSSLNVVDIKVCETRLGHMNASEKPLQPFVGTVKFGAGEARRLRTAEGYQYFYPTAGAPAPHSSNLQ